MKFFRTNAARWRDGACFERVGDDFGVIARLGTDGEVFVVACGEAAKVSEALLDFQETPGMPAIYERVLIEESTCQHLSPAADRLLGPHRGKVWDFFYRDTPVDLPDGGQLVTRLDSDLWRDQIMEVLVASNPRTSAIRDFDDLYFYGYVRDGVLGGVMGAERWLEGEQRIAHFAGLGTNPTMTGQGIGTAVMSAAINYELEATDIITFGMWVENDGARRIYNRIGLHQGERMMTCSVHPLSPN